MIIARVAVQTKCGHAAVAKIGPSLEQYLQRPISCATLPFSDTMKAMSLDDYKVVLYRNEPNGWVAEVPSIPGCHALMPTREGVITELAAVFQMISDEYAERNQMLPADTTEILHA